VIRHHASQALNVLDKFHIVAHLNKAVDDTRRLDAAELRRQGDKVTLKHTRWYLLKRTRSKPMLAVPLGAQSGNVVAGANATLLNAGRAKAKSRVYGWEYTANGGTTCTAGPRRPRRRPPSPASRPTRPTASAPTSPTPTGRAPGPRS
jgi:Transposase